MFMGIKRFHNSPRFWAPKFQLWKYNPQERLFESKSQSVPYNSLEYTRDFCWIFKIYWFEINLGVGRSQKIISTFKYLFQFSRKISKRVCKLCSKLCTPKEVLKKFFRICTKIFSRKSWESWSIFSIISPRTPKPIELKHGVFSLKKKKNFLTAFGPYNIIAFERWG